MEFNLQVSQNKYLPASGREMHAILSVVGESPGAEASGSARADPRRLGGVLVIDCSGPRATPPTKTAAARRATAAAIDVLPDGVRFAVVEGTERARMVFPSESRLMTASA